MQRVGVPPSLRGPLRDGARAAIEGGAEAIFDNGVGVSFSQHPKLQEKYDGYYFYHIKRRQA